MTSIKTNWMIGSITAIVLLFGVYFMVNAVEKVENVESAAATQYEWFDANTMTPLGQGSLADQQSSCGTSEETPCAIGIPLDENGAPVEDAEPVTVFRANP